VRSTASRLEIRPYEDPDEAAVLGLLDASLGGGPTGARSAEFFRWKHVTNVFGRSFMLVAEAEDRIVGFRAFMRWRLRAGDDLLSAVRAVDTATHPDFQGRGIFRTLTLEALDRLRGDVDLIFNTPNEKSLPGYLKMGWRTVGKLPVLVAPRHPIQVLRRWRGAETSPARRVEGPTAAEALGDPDVFKLLTDRSEPRLHTVKTHEYLGWRYADAPLLGYRAVTERDPGGGLVGMALFRVRQRGGLSEATVAELLVGDGGPAAGRRLLRAVGRTGRVDHLAMLFPPRSLERSVARRVGALRAPSGVTMVCNPLRANAGPDPTMLSSWALTTGDVEVF
jgi:GNAT superfamily N-acetyltransferase